MASMIHFSLGNPEGYFQIDKHHSATCRVLPENRSNLSAARFAINKGLLAIRRTDPLSFPVARTRELNARALKAHAKTRRTKQLADGPGVDQDIPIQNEIAVSSSLLRINFIGATGTATKHTDFVRCQREVGKRTLAGTAPRFAR